MISTTMKVHSYSPIRDNDDRLEMLVVEKDGDPEYSQTMVLRVDRCMENAAPPGTEVTVTIDTVS